MERVVDDGVNLERDKLEEDHFFLRAKLKNLKHESSGILDFERKKSLDRHEMYLKQSLYVKGKITTDEKYINILNESFDKIHPLIYLSQEQRKAIRENIILEKFDQKVVLYSGMADDYDPGEWACFILLEGEIHIFNNRHTFQELINSVTFFGYDGPIFQKRLSTVLVEKNSVIGIIQQKDFLQLIHPFSKFATFISRNIRYKDKVLDDLMAFKNFVLSSIDKGPLEISRMLDLYRKVNSCLHTKALSDDLDVTAWTYALNRLPQNTIETYIFVLITKPPKLLSLNEELSTTLLPRMQTNARNRDCYKFLDGKDVVVVRELETDVLDFISNMCIHLIESTKLRRYLSSPITISKIFQAKDDFNSTLQVLMNTTGIYINKTEGKMLYSVFGDQFAQKLIHLCLNNQDVNLSVLKDYLTDKDTVENWIQNLWNVTRSVLNVNSSVDEIDDLVVDIVQGSKKTLLSCISPHIYKHRTEIMTWAVENNIKLKTTVFFNENDKLIAYSHYYYLAFPEKQREKELMDQEHGIVTIRTTFGTGVKVLVINVNKLNPEFIDPDTVLKPASKNHIILYLGYTFGAQSHHLIKPVLMLFGSKARSMNIIGKAGTLVGRRSDILLASKVFHDKSHDVASVNYGEMDISELKKITHCDIYVGPMLTVAGTILQNNDLLNFYKYVMGCIGLEMEGYYYAREVENSIKHSLLREDFVSRLFYYASDLPLDPTQNLSTESSVVSWDEGIGSMNAIQRFILKQIFKEDKRNNN
jgi:hypothetical protein